MPSRISELLRIKDTLKVAGTFSSVIYSPYSDTPILQVAPDSVCISDRLRETKSPERYPLGPSPPEWYLSEDEAAALLQCEEKRGRSRGDSLGVHGRVRDTLCMEDEGSRVLIALVLIRVCSRLQREAEGSRGERRSRLSRAM